VRFWRQPANSVKFSTGTLTSVVPLKPCCLVGQMCCAFKALDLDFLTQAEAVMFNPHKRCDFMSSLAGEHSCASDISCARVQAVVRTSFIMLQVVYSKDQRHQCTQSTLDPCSPYELSYAIQPRSTQVVASQWRTLHLLSARGQPSRRVRIAHSRRRM
jgi:hypothetical protein